MLHGMLFGAFFLFAAFALLLEAARLWHPREIVSPTKMGRRIEGAYFVIAAACGWLAVFSGTYLVYPWYRAAQQPGVDLHAYPRSLLLAATATAPLHTVGMEWKEHVAFIAPICFTTIAWIVSRHPSEARRPEVRRVLLVFGLVAFVTAAVSGAVGALLNKAAPTEGPRSTTVPRVSSQL